MIKLRPYQEEVARTILDSVMNKKGLTLSVEIARQGGKNELSAIIELTLLTLYVHRGGSAIKASPTFKPQTIISIQRLKQHLDDFGFCGGAVHASCFRFDIAGTIHGFGAAHAGRPIWVLPFSRVFE